MFDIANGTNAVWVVGCLLITFWYARQICAAKKMGLGQPVGRIMFGIVALSAGTALRLGYWIAGRAAFAAGDLETYVEMTRLAPVVYIPAALLCFAGVCLHLYPALVVFFGRYWIVPPAAIMISAFLIVGIGL